MEEEMLDTILNFSIFINFVLLHIKNDYSLPILMILSNLKFFSIIHQLLEFSFIIHTRCLRSYTVMKNIFAYVTKSFLVSSCRVGRSV